MKKIKYIVLAALALTGLAACTSDNLADEKSLEEKYENGAYLAISVVTDNGATRAYPDDNPDYQPGSASTTPAENEVRKVYCYFYGADDSYIKEEPINPTPTFNDGAGTVEKVCDGTVVLEGKSLLARKLIVLVNPSNAVKTAIQGKDLKTAKKLIDDYSSTSDGFLMSNSVYRDGTTNVCEVNFTDHDFYEKDKSLAEKNPIEVYVERVQAKVDVDMSKLQCKQTHGIAVFDGTKNTPDTFSVQPVVMALSTDQAVIVADQTLRSNLLKDITSSTLPLPTWADVWKNNNGQTPAKWTRPADHRCFWALSSDEYTPAGGSKVTNIKENPAYPASTIALSTTNNKYTTYVQENTSNTPTKVLVFAQLKKVVNGVLTNDNVELLECRGAYYTESGLLTTIAHRLTNDKGYYYIVDGDNDADGSPNKHDITASMFEVVRTNVAPASHKQWAFKVQLKKTGTGAIAENHIYKDGTTNLTDFNTLVNEHVGYYWKDGKCYYYTEIKHDIYTDATNADTKESSRVSGVVRNHYYQITLNTINGLGVPVFEVPGEPIIPETPEKTDWYLAAKINTLKWRVVTQSVDLGK